MTTAASGAVFFLGSRAHYQVLQPPESRYDAENGNASTESIYQNPSVQQLDNSNKYIGDNLSYCDNDVNAVIEEREKENNGIKRRTKRRQSEIALCERDMEMKPALLNNLGENDTPKSKPSRRRVNLLAFLTSLTRRKRRLDSEQIQYLQHIESALTHCTYRESCRCLECQSRYFDVDESDYSSDECEYCEYTDYAARYVIQEPPPPEPEEEDDDDDEVFIDSAPGDNTSTDLLIEREKPVSSIREMSVSSDDTEPPQLEIEVAAGTPVLLNYLLTHPITCAIQ